MSVQLSSLLPNTPATEKCGIIEQYNSYLVVPEKRKDALLRVFCFSCAGGSAGTYSAKWSSDLPKSVEYVGVQLPGRQARVSEKPIQDMKLLIEEIVNSMEKLISKDEKPYAFFGHSLGTIIAYETALEIRRRQLPLPMSLFLSGRGAPGSPDPIDVPVDCDLPDRAFADLCVKHFGPSSGLIDPRSFPVTLPPLRSDLKLYYSYDPAPSLAEPPLPVPVVVWGATGDIFSQAPLIGTWKAITSKSFKREMLSEDRHHFIDRRKFKTSFSRYIDRLGVKLLEEEVWC